MSSTPQILYFDIRGRAEPIRLLLEDIGVEYEDRQITPEEWTDIKPTTPFGRMPIYRDDEVEIPETFAIMRYLGRKHDLLGPDESSRIRCDVTIESWRDYGNRTAAVFGAKSDSEVARTIFIDEELPQCLAALEAFYAANTGQSYFWAGDSLTIADFAAFHLIEGVKIRFSELLSTYQGLSEFAAQFACRPRIQEYLNSPRRPAALFYGPAGKIYPAKP